MQSYSQKSIARIACKLLSSNDERIIENAADEGVWRGYRKAIADFLSACDITPEDTEDPNMFVDYVVIDEGMLLTPDDKEFEQYSHVYNYAYGYYDEAQYYAHNLSAQIKHARERIQLFGDMSYIIIQRATFDADVLATTPLDQIDVTGETYFPCDVEFSIAKINGKIIENFIQKPSREM